MTFDNNENDVPDKNNASVPKDREIYLTAGFGVILGILTIAFSGHFLGVVFGVVVLGISFFVYGAHFKSISFKLFGGLTISLAIIIPSCILTLLLILRILLSGSR